MRLVAAIAGILVSIPPLLFAWVGTQTFIRPRERKVAAVVTAQTGALLLMSLGLLLSPYVQIPQAILLVVTVATSAFILKNPRFLE